MTQAGRVSAVPDTGLYGPDSVTWRVHGDPAMALGGGACQVICVSDLGHRVG